MKKIVFLILTLTILSGFGTLAASPETDSALKKAYKKEFAFLEAQKKALTERIEKFNSESDAKVKQAETELESLQDELLKLNVSSDSLQTALIEAERESSVTVEKRDVVINTIEQAEVTLEKHGVKVEKSENMKAEEGPLVLEKCFKSAGNILKDVSGVKKVQGEFYLTSGEAVKGDIYKIGSIAAYGVSPKGSGALAPAGNSAFKIWPVNDMETVNKITSGQFIDSAGMFIFESLDKEIQKKKSKGPMDVVRAGGTIAWVIVFLGLFTLLLVILRIAFLRGAAQNTVKLINKIENPVKEKNIESAITLCQQNRGAISRVLAATLRNIDKDSEYLEDIISESILHENTWLDRFGSLILVFAAVAPLLGLLGTVTGMISTFDIITEFGTGDPKLLSSGISEALITTELGLIVAIPALLFGNLLSGWAGNIKSDMEQAALHVINIYRNAGKSGKEAKVGQ